MNKEQLETDYALEVIKREILITKGLIKSKTVYLPVEAVVELIDRVQELEKEVEYCRRVSSVALNDILNNDETYITNEEIIVQTLKALEGEE